MTFWLWFFYLALLLFIWRYALWFPREVVGVTRAKPLLIGHRGVRGDREENTFEAFEFAFKEGLDGIECDVQKSEEGVLVLYHDFEMQEKLIANLTIEQMRELGEPFGFVEDLLELSKHYSGTLLNLEIKSRAVRTDGVEAATLQLVKKHNLLDRVIFSSFNPVSVLRIRLLCPEARVALLFSPDMPDLLRSGWLAGWLHVDALHPYESQVDDVFLRKAAYLGINVNTWTVNDPMRISSLYKQNIGAIIGDNPAVLKQAIR